METWKEVQGYDGRYEVSSLGNFRNFDGRRLAVDYMKNGYGKVYLYQKGKRKMHYAHRLVAQHFVPNPESKDQVNHINSVRQDNRALNLEWSTAKENASHAIKYGMRQPEVVKMNRRIKELERENAELKMVGG